MLDHIARRSSTRARLVDSGAIFVVCAPLLIALVRVVFGSTYVPSGDTALIEFNVRDASHVPMLGVYSRFGWNHPGPLLYYVLAVPYRVFGRSSTGLLVGAIVLNIAAVVVAAVVARRVAGRVALLGTLALAVLVIHGLGSADVISPWNPDVTVLPTLVVLVGAWAVATRHLGALPVLAIAATFVVQAHAGYGPVVGILTLTALGFLAADQVRTSDARRDLVRYGAIAVAALFVLWLLPAIQQFTHHPGNLQKLATFSRRAGDRSLGTGLKLVASAYAIVPPWLTHSQRAQPFTGELLPDRWALGLVTLVALAAGVVVCIGFRKGVELPVTRLVFLLAIVVPVEVFAAAKIVGPAYSYLLQWLWVLAAATWFALAWLVAVRWPRSRVVVGAIVGVVALGFAVANFFTASGATRPDSGPLPEIAREFIAPVVAATRTAPGPVRVQGIGIDAQAYAEGLQLQLVKRGHDALAPDVPLMAIKLRSPRIDHGDRAPTVITVAGGPTQALNGLFGQPVGTNRADIESLRKQPGFTQIASIAVPPTAAELRQTKDAVARLQARGAIDAATARQIVADDLAGRANFAVFVSPGDAPLPAGMAARR